MSFGVRGWGFALEFGGLGFLRVSAPGWRVCFHVQDVGFRLQGAGVALLCFWWREESLGLKLFFLYKLSARRKPHVALFNKNLVFSWASASAGSGFCLFLGFFLWGIPGFWDLIFEPDEEALGL